MICFIIAGMPASGKNIARSYARKNDIPYFATGDIVRQEIEKRHIDPTPENTAALSTQLRGTDGLGVTRLALGCALKTKSGSVFLEGMRSWPEIQLIRENMRARVIAFIAPRETRRERIISRGRPDDSPSSFDERDQREIDYGAAAVVALADEYVLNIHTEENALDRLREIVEKYVHR